MKGSVVILIVVVLLLLAAGVAPLLQADPGYVALQFHDWTVETSVVVLLAMLLVLYLTIRMLVWLWQSPKRAADRLAQRRTEQQLQKGLLALSEGDWKSAEKALARSARAASSRSRTLSYLAAARAAQGQDKAERRDEYLALADSDGSGGRREVFLVRLARARMLIADENWSAAREQLEDLLKQQSQHPQLLRLLARVYQAQSDWSALARILPQLRKARVLGDDELARLQVEVKRSEIRLAPDFGELQTRWKQLSRSERVQAAYASAFADRAIELEHPDAAEPVIRNSLKQAWDSDLVRRYSATGPDGVKAKLKQAGKWLDDHPQDANLHFVLAQLCLKLKLWGKASDHLRASLAADPTVEASRALADLYRRHGELDAAMIAYRNALAIADGGTPEPVPATRLGSHASDTGNGDDPDDDKLLTPPRGAY